MRPTRTLTRSGLAEIVGNRLGLSHSESLYFVETIVGHMMDALTSGENVKISGFGSFLVRDKPERVGRNPRTGAEVAIVPRRVLIFRPSTSLRERCR